MNEIYDNPDLYAHEHGNAHPDVPYYVRLCRQWKPRRILDWACGDGRLTLPLAETAAEWGGQMEAMDVSESMIEAARKAPNPHGVQWHLGDLRSWQPSEPVDLIVCGCSSLSHLTNTPDLVAAWSNAYQSLTIGGRFMVSEVAPDYATMAESMRIPPRSVVQWDRDVESEAGRLLRCRSSRYRAHLQQLRVEHFYDQFTSDAGNDRAVNEYLAHVFFPTELRLLFLHAGFTMEFEHGNYAGEAFSHASTLMNFCGNRNS